MVGEGAVEIGRRAPQRFESFLEGGLELRQGNPRCNLLHRGGIIQLDVTRKTPGGGMAEAKQQAWDNPIQTDGFEFVEYAAPDPRALGALFEQLGFQRVARHRHKDVALYKQGDVNFILNAEPRSFAQNFARRHGPSVCAMAFRVRDAANAYEKLVERGAWGVENPVGPGELNIPAIKGIRDSYHGEGIQHIALHSADIYRTVDALRAKGVELLDTPDTYYEMVDKRLPGHGEPLEELRRRRILVDGNPAGGFLLQIFTKTVIGPIFFEIIQRKGDEGFGEGNFRALFESMELDQVRRGVLKPAA